MEFEPATCRKLQGEIFRHSVIVCMTDDDDDDDDVSTQTIIVDSHFLYA